MFDSFLSWLYDIFCNRYLIETKINVSVFNVSDVMTRLCCDNFVTFSVFLNSSQCMGFDREMKYKG